MFLGDVMLGRGVGVVAAADPASIFEQLRPVLLDADLALANLESPLTLRPHRAAGFALEADPAAAPLLASAGIDVVGLANNHAMDAGPSTVADTVAAVAAAGVLVVGAGEDQRAAAAPLMVRLGGILVGILAFDLSGGAGAGVSSPGVNTWEPVAAQRAVANLRAAADVVVVGLHGGVEYLGRPDPVLERVVAQLGSWGADVVWGHGAHVPYPVNIATSTGTRSAVLAPGLGNALFDQRLPGTDTGALLEVLVDRSGVLAMRTGQVSITAGRTAFSGWEQPEGDAVALGADWWSPVRSVVEQPATSCEALDEASIIGSLPAGSIVSGFGCGAVTGTEADAATGADLEMVVAYRRPATAELLQRAFPGHQWVDHDGMTAHLAVMAADGTMRWGAATLLDPISTVAACSGSLALGFTSLDDPTLTGAGAWTWHGFGFRTAPVLTGPASIGCVDVDNDGMTEPLVRRASEI